MQLTEQEVLQVFTNRYYESEQGYVDKGKILHALKEFVEVFTNNLSTIKLKEEPKPKTVGELLYEQLSNATAAGDLEAVTIYSQAIQRLS